ncbi:MAG: HU family DNA-binding protein [Erysipelotrichaceae bacterium]|nr:HU family DNA-binding protein [Erysipelotrichaceae bacterium]
MNKKELIDIVSNKREMTKKDAEMLVNTVFDTMVETMVEGEKVVISGFGTFRINERQERKGVSPKTKDEITIPACRAVTFKPSNRLKEAMNDSLTQES